MKTVGKRKPSRGLIQEAAGFLKMVVRIFSGNSFIPKGVYRLKSHEEAQSWTQDIIAKSRK